MSLTELNHAVAELTEKERGLLVAWLLESPKPHGGGAHRRRESSKPTGDVRNWIRAASNRLKRIYRTLLNEV